MERQNSEEGEGEYVIEHQNAELQRGMHNIAFD